ncbi:N-methyl-L-tryptophan oxidase [Rubellicoccus peritrichatus]|uniref:N-methyl-L-tryptophan oxidase n=1 Tax=Rubellicoccus peritrichatus TaxID=3080537 RepID=A0AAQ3QWB3_9BACT|nr:N-methyl-L-tryptophan oxidase [Puniceicoccus sp. CR14]WOO41717.1 N-methyl-L-tryptophan oxidase [Puniceicoccus sp. CR14]
MQEADIIVVGVGAMGSSALYHLSKSGANIIGLERFKPGHDRGSSHGECRMIRKAYFEHPNYIPLLNRAYELWDDLNSQVPQPLFHRTGLIIYGPPESPLIEGIDQAASEHDLPIEKINAAGGQDRFPHLRVPAGMTGRYEADGGYLEVENTIRAYAELAEENGVTLINNCELLDWKTIKDKVQLETSQGTFQAKKMIVAGGAWNAGILKLPKIPFKVHRVMQFWFASNSDYTAQNGFPSFAFYLPEGFYYGFPGLNNVIKVAQHAPGAFMEDPDQLNPMPLPEEVAAIKKAVKTLLPDLPSTPVRHSACMYTMTPDQHFLIDHHPETDNIIIAGGFSGHGFKFSPVIGEILSELSLTGQTRHSIDFLRWRWS